MTEPAARLDATIRVGGESGYHVHVGTGILGRLGEILAGFGPDLRRVMLVRPVGLDGYADAVRGLLADAGYEVRDAVVPDAESAKTAAVAATLWGDLGLAGFTRSDAVVTLGGGSVSDLGGFVAATWLRGVRVIHLPTTLLGMVDAAVGGKTGINTAEGKNLVGSFHPPSGVICDLATLETLPAADLTAGLAEVLKAGFIADPVILDICENRAGRPLAWDDDELADLVVRSIQVKADVVTADLKEASLREILNYGHTFAHAVEQVHGYTLRHGEAVAVGMVFAAELGARTGHTPAELVARHRSVLADAGLPTRYEQDGWVDLLAVMRRDKKTRGDHLRFVVLDAVAEPTRLVDPPDEALDGAFAALRSAAPS